eukprot:14502643-Alexandrium_andersonii.AAC.1
MDLLEGHPAVRLLVEAVQEERQAPDAPGPDRHARRNQQRGMPLLDVESERAALCRPHALR